MRGSHVALRRQTMGQYIECSLHKKWDDWKKDWFYTTLPDHPRLWLPTGPPEETAAWRATAALGDEYDAVLIRLNGLRAQGLTSAMVYGDYLRRRIAPLQERARGAWAYTGFDDPMRTHVGRHWEWSRDDLKFVIQRVLNLPTIEPSLIPDSILPLYSDRDSIIAIMMVVGAAGDRGLSAGARRRWPW